MLKLSLFKIKVPSKSPITFSEYGIRQEINLSDNNEYKITSMIQPLVKELESSSSVKHVACNRIFSKKDLAVYVEVILSIDNENEDMLDQSTLTGNPGIKYENKIIDFIAKVNQGIALLNANSTWPAMLSSKSYDKPGVNVIVVGNKNIQYQIINLASFYGNTADIPILIGDTEKSLLNCTFKRDKNHKQTSEEIPKEISINSIDLNKNSLKATHSKYTEKRIVEGLFYFDKKLADKLRQANGHDIRVLVHPYRKQLFTENEKPTSYQIIKILSLAKSSDPQISLDDGTTEQN